MISIRATLFASVHAVHPATLSSVISSGLHFGQTLILQSCRPKRSCHSRRSVLYFLLTIHPPSVNRNYPRNDLRNTVAHSVVCPCLPDCHSNSCTHRHAAANNRKANLRYQQHSRTSTIYRIFHSSRMYYKTFLFVLLCLVNVPVCAFTGVSVI